LDTPIQENVVRRRDSGKGQTLVEFALTLPILFLLVFGVVEFGRVFQSWVTLQNSVRTAARYATTGAYNTTRFELDDSGLDDYNSIVPCVAGNVGGQNLDRRGTIDTYEPGDGSPSIQIYRPPTDADNTSSDTADESLFATWWDGMNCDPRDSQHQSLRKDILRLFSIMEQARIGAAGLPMGPDLSLDVVDAESARRALFDVWYRPLDSNGVSNVKRANSDQPSYWEIMICSNRRMIDQERQSAYEGQARRYAMFIDADDFVSGIPPIPRDERAPLCALNEITDNEGATVNARSGWGAPWLDPGDAGDTITIVVNFNHPLITPLGLAPYIPLQARRTAVNEAFRPVDSRDILANTPNLGGGFNNRPISRAGDDQVHTATLDGLGRPIETTVTLDGSQSVDYDGFIVSWNWYYVSPGGARVNIGNGATLTLPFNVGEHRIYLQVVDDDGAVSEPDDMVIITIQPPEGEEEPPVDPTPTIPPPTDLPFTCDQIFANQVSFFGNQMFINITNGNVQDTTLLRVIFRWRTLPEFPNMYVSHMSLDGSDHWVGRDTTPPTDTDSDPTTPPGLFNSSQRTLHRESNMTWAATFANGPGTISNYMAPHYFAGTEYFFSHPNGSDCRITLELPEPTATPPNPPMTDTPPPPDCTPDEIQIRFGEFRSFGVVVLWVYNSRSTVSVIRDFNLSWNARGNNNIMVLERVTAGGSGPADNSTPTVTLWEGNDTTPPTRGRSEGTWVSDYTIPPNWSTPIYLDFGGTTTTVQTAFGAQPSDFTNNAWFNITCGPTGPGINVNIPDLPTPVPTNTPRPTDPPRPTNTPWPTQPPRPTNTPRPTDPPRPTQPPPPTPTNRPIIPTATVPFGVPTNTPIGGSGGDG
jgi:hypothetical protein